MKVDRTTTDIYVVEAVDRALDLLEVFKDSEELSLNEICGRVGMNKSRTFRLLHTLAKRGYVERTMEGLRYKLGLKLFEHATHFRRDVRRVAQPFMRRLRERFNETINLAVIHDGEVVYVDLLESSRPFRMAAMVGSRMAIQSTSLGKAIIAYSPENELTAFLNQLPPAESRNLKKEIETVRLRGYAVDREENEPGVACVGAPIFDEKGAAIAALSVSGPVGRMLKQEREIGSVLAAICGEISRNLGFVGKVTMHSHAEFKTPARMAVSA